MSDLTKYQEYALIQKEIKRLEAKKDLLRAEIEVMLPEDGFKDDTINVFWTKKTKWTYTDAVKVIENSLKTQKKLEEESGDAKAEEIKQLTIKVK